MQYNKRYLIFQRKTTSPPKQNGVANGEPSNSKTSSINLESRGKENKEQNHCQDDNDEQMDNGEKKKKGKEGLFVHLELEKG